MKLNFGFLIYGAAFLTAAMFTACSDDDDQVQIGRASCRERV